MRALGILLLSSWTRDVGRGSGTTRALDGLVGGLEALGHRVSTVPVPHVPGRRLAYNLSLPLRVRGTRPDLTLAVDADGAALHAVPRPYVVLLKGVAADEARFERGATRLAMRALARAEATNARRADRVVVPSEYSRSQAVVRYGVHPSRVVVVPEGIDQALWARLRSRPPAARAPEPTVLTVARQYPRKNTAALLAALPALAERVPDVRLRIVGEGPRSGALRRLACELGVAERTTFLGTASDEELHREYFRAWCFCLPSLQEAFGLSPLEAMAAGLPVVAARTSALPEVVGGGDAGILVDPTPEALAGALAGVLADPDAWSRLSRGGVARSTAFGLERAAEAVLAAAAPAAPRPAGSSGPLRRSGVPGREPAGSGSLR